LGIPYFYFIGLISGYLSLVPYLGVIVAVIPPAAAGLGVVGLKGLIIIAGTVLGVHLFAMNVLYPKILGKRLQLNPLVVTVSLLFWGFVWGALGLLLAVPVTAGLKIICDHVDGWQGIGELMGEGKEDVA
jgi:predicted PurR-regulated permease PerM